MGANLASLDDDELAELDGYITELERLNRVHRAEVDLMYFAWEYFSDAANEGNNGNWDGFDLKSPEDAADFHKNICGIIDDVSNVRKNGKVAVAAPRSHGKSTYLSRATPLREVIFRKRRYIMVLSETPMVATANIDWIGGQLKTNAKLRADFGPLLNPKGNDKDNSTEFIAYEETNGIKRDLTLVQVASTGGAIRGRNWNGVRPDLIICDDLEDARPGGNAATKEQREKLKEWFASSVLPLGDPKGKRTAFIYMGTIVHNESLLNDVIKNNSEFESTLYSAIIEEPERMDLWEQCRAIFNDDQLEKKERRQKAIEFYEANRDEMDKGAEVLWKEAQPILRLYLWKWTYGSKAFNTEYQNKPRDEENQIFIIENLRKYDESDLLDASGYELPLEYFAYWDWALGKSNRSDYNAIVTIARDRRTGVIYTIDTWAKKCPSHEALKMAVEIIKDYGHKTFAVETIGAGHEFYQQLRELLAKERIYGTKIKPIAHHKSNKEERIESLEPLCESGFLRFKRSQRLLFDQLEQFPHGTHDDLPDALAGAVDLAGGTRRRRTFHKKPSGL
ncbi:phage terminase large subunit [Bacillus sp. FJAT-27445]|uniref:phage terminase large subunit n=1 Tax=Bacillus sp. FJAT-27445 TaxID=1679166 RepID=UPI00067175CC|nr:phage terminase large subunit [Bacillus sp. FJAT-27445]